MLWNELLRSAVDPEAEAVALTRRIVETNCGGEAVAAAADAGCGWSLYDDEGGKIESDGSVLRI